MSRKTGIWTLFALILVLVLGWHFFIKPYNYRVSFTIKDPAGLVFSNLRAWQGIKGLEDSSSVQLMAQDSMSLTQQLKIKDSLFEYRWQIVPQSDSTTAVTAYITDLNNTLVQNLYSPVVKNAFVKRSLKTVEDLATEWVDYRKRYRVGPVTEGAQAGKFAAYVRVNSTASKKANSMMRNIADVMGYINSSGLSLDGDPFLQVTRWDRATDSITFDFCFPVKAVDSLPPSEVVKFKQVADFKGIKTIFNGNYSISDKAWYWLERHAKNTNTAVEYLPFEVYKNDPHMGGDALQWEAEVFLPLKNQ